ncbi:MAG: rhodanese-like domain-containing protein [Chloroflexi bacterium]|nr:rhodanese-like domain-containing protein [Chloroflexota bacterium]
MKRIRVPFPFLVIAALLLGSCQSAPAQTVAAATPTAAVAQSAGDYWGLVEQAQQAYAGAAYASAMQFARQAAIANPEDDTAWELYAQASVANAGDTYLQEIPDHRYRLPVDVFVRDRVNHAKDWFVIDVREPDEFAAGHIAGAINIPYREILRHLDELPNSKAAPILLYCHSQKRAAHDLVILHELGYRKVYNLEGGYEAYEEWMTNNAIPTPGPTPTPGPNEPDFGC